MWAQNSFWASVAIFNEWANEIRARKFVPQQPQTVFVRYVLKQMECYRIIDVGTKGCNLLVRVTQEKAKIRKCIVVKSS